MPLLLGTSTSYLKRATSYAGSRPCCGMLLPPNHLRCPTAALLLTATHCQPTCCRTESSKKKPPIYKVMLHNDNYNRREYVVKILLKTVEGLTVDDAVNVMQVGDSKGHWAAGGAAGAIAAAATMALSFSARCWLSQQALHTHGSKGRDGGRSQQHPCLCPGCLQRVGAGRVCTSNSSVAATWLHGQ